MRTTLTLFWLLALLAGSIPRGYAQEQNALFRNDLRLLACELPRRHVHLFAKIGKEDFDARVAVLDARIDSLGPEAFAVELMRLAAAAGDEHTRIEPAGLFRHALPVRFGVFDEGLFITAATEQRLFFARLLAVGGMPVSEVLERLRTLVPSGNESYFKAILPDYLNNAFLLRGLGISSSCEEASYTLAAADGDTLTVLLRPDPQAALVAAPQLAALPASRGAGSYVCRYFPQESTLYFNYRRCREDAACPFVRFNGELWATVARENPRKLVVDLRQNGGGNSAVLRPFLDSLAGSGQRCAGRLYVLIGRRTFSSALLNALELERKFGAVLIGEPTAGSVNHYGEVRTFTLPATGATVHYSTRYFERRKGCDGPLKPRVDVGCPVGSLRGGHDEALERVFRD